MGFFEDDPELTDFQKKQLIGFVDEVNRLNIRTSNDNLFLKEFMQQINELDIFHNYESPWNGDLGKSFKELSQENQRESLIIIEPIIELAKQHLHLITSYNDLMKHIKEIRDFRIRYWEAKKLGGDICPNYNFFNKFKSKIGVQWFGLAHLVCYYEKAINKN